VLAVFGEVSPALSTSEARQLFANHFKTPLSAVTATCHGPCEFLLFFTDPVKAKEAQTYSGKLVLGGTSFLLRPWSRLRRALTASLPYKVRVCLEGVPEHAHDIVSVTPLFAGEAMVDYFDDMIWSEKESGCVRIWLWMEDVDKLARRATLMLEEPMVDGPAVAHHPSVGIFSDVAYRPGPVAVVEHQVIIHLDRVVDRSRECFNGGVSPVSHITYGSDINGMASESSRDINGTITWSYTWVLGEEA
jgi:hypothetical protein